MGTVILVGLVWGLLGGLAAVQTDSVWPIFAAAALAAATILLVEALA